MRTWPLRSPLPVLAVGAIVATSGCGGPQHGSGEEVEMRALTEGRAMQLIVEVLSDRGLTGTRGWQPHVEGGAQVEVDVRIGNTQGAIEFVSAQDRLDQPHVFPPPDPDNLRILPGAPPDETARVLVLHDTQYRYDPRGEDVRLGAHGATEVEDRFKRDVGDFIEYMRGQGMLGSH